MRACPLETLTPTEAVRGAPPRFKRTDHLSNTGGLPTGPPNRYWVASRLTPDLSSVAVTWDTGAARSSGVTRVASFRLASGPEGPCLAQRCQQPSGAFERESQCGAMP